MEQRALPGIWRRIIGLAMVVACSLTACPAVAAQPPGGKAYQDAAAQFEKLSGGAIGDENVPRMSEPGIAPLLRTLADANAVFGDERYGVEDLPAVMAICGKANAVFMRYALSGMQKLKSRVQAGASASELAGRMAALMEANILRYQDEALPVSAFGMRCQAQVVPLMTTFAERLRPEEFTEVRRAGLRQMRKGVMNSLVGTLAMAGNKAIRVANQRSVMNAVGDVADVYAAALTTQQRRTVMQVALSSRSKVPAELKPQVDKLLEAVERTDCTGLCAL